MKLIMEGKSFMLSKGYYRIVVDVVRGVEKVFCGGVVYKYV